MKNYKYKIRMNRSIFFTNGKTEKLIGILKDSIQFIERYKTKNKEKILILQKKGIDIFLYPIEYEIIKE